MSDELKCSCNDDNKFKSRKWIAVVFWWVVLGLALIAQAVFAFVWPDIKLPLTEIVIISGGITGAYFGFNILDKWVQK